MTVLRVRRTLLEPPPRAALGEQTMTPPLPVARADATETYEREIAIRREERRVFGVEPPPAIPRSLLSTIDPPGADIPDPSLRGVAGIDRGPPIHLQRQRVPAGYRPLPRPEHIRQGALGDCWLLATFAALAHTHPEIIAAGIRQISPSTFRVFGELVDTDFPVASGRSIFADTAGPALWVGLIEKRFAQRFLDRAPRRYASIDGDLVSFALTELGIASHDLGTAKMPSADWIARVSDAVRARQPVCVGVHETSTRGGIVLEGPHEYTVLDVRERDGHTEFLLRNPWGFDTNSTPADAEGTFWIPATALYGMVNEATIGDLPPAR
ncbi:MAG: hypothetical protein IT381_00445 [Deltaproteobacteria bacterium]|nr:hypothetical protein [Deltaproteobacteria bacterium]